jgi:DNA transformation protein
MGQKGDKHTNEAALSAQLLVDKLSLIGKITSKKMFGGHGIFHDGTMFGIIDSQGAAYFKAGDSNEADFLAENAERHGKMPYYKIPESIMLNSRKLTDWAEKAIIESKV